jgi:hypothetical protein
MRKIALACVLGAQAFHPVAAHAAAKDFALQGYALPAGKAVFRNQMQTGPTRRAIKSKRR